MRERGQFGLVPAPGGGRPVGLVDAVAWAGRRSCRIAAGISRQPCSAKLWLAPGVRPTPLRGHNPRSVHRVTVLPCQQYLLLVKQLEAPTVSWAGSSLSGGASDPREGK